MVNTLKSLATTLCNIPFREKEATTNLPMIKIAQLLIQSPTPTTFTLLTVTKYNYFSVNKSLAP